MRIIDDIRHFVWLWHEHRERIWGDANLSFRPVWKAALNALLVIALSAPFFPANLRDMTAMVWRCQVEQSILTAGWIESSELQTLFEWEQEWLRVVVARYWGQYRYETQDGPVHGALWSPGLIINHRDVLEEAAKVIGYAQFTALRPGDGLLVRRHPLAASQHCLYYPPLLGIAIVAILGGIYLQALLALLIHAIDAYHVLRKIFGRPFLQS